MHFERPAIAVDNCVREGASVVEPVLYQSEMIGAVMRELLTAGWPLWRLSKLQLPTLRLTDPAFRPGVVVTPVREKEICS